MPNKLRSTSPSTWRISTRWTELSVAACESVSTAKNLYPSLGNYSGTMRTPMTKKPNTTLGNASLILESSFEPLLRYREAAKMNLASTIGNENYLMLNSTGFQKSGGRWPAHNK